MNAEEFVNEMDHLAQVHFGEFGYDTCSSGEKKAVIQITTRQYKVNTILNG